MISIVTPNYNHGNYLSKCIESVLTQNYSDFELIIVEDGSTDSSMEIIQHYMKQDTRIRLVAHKKNQGIMRSLEDGFRFASGKYFHGLSADDHYLPGFLDKSLSLLEQHPHIGLCCARYCSFSDQSPISTAQFRHAATNPLILSPPAVVKALRNYALQICGQTCIVRKLLLKKYGFFNPQLHAKMDWFLFTTIALFEGAIYIPEPLTAFRISSCSYSVACQQNQAIKRETHFTLCKLLENPHNKELRKQFRQSGVPGFLFKDIRIIKYPKLWMFYPILIFKFLCKRWARL